MSGTRKLAAITGVRRRRLSGPACSGGQRSHAGAAPGRPAQRPDPTRWATASTSPRGSRGCQARRDLFSEDAYRQVKGRLDLEVSDLGPTPLKNIAEPIGFTRLKSACHRGEASDAELADATRRARREGARCWRCRLSQSPSCSPLAPPLAFGGSPTDPRRSPRAAGRGGASLDRRAAVHQSFRRPEPRLFRRRHTENLTTDLSRLSGSFVIARNTAFTFKGKNADAREIGKELGVRYVLEGSVQRDQNQCASMHN